MQSTAADPVSLGNCDREPIHVPGSIQPHGVMLVLDRENLQVEQIAGDAPSLLGIDADRAIGLPLFALINADAEHFVKRHLGAPRSVIAPTICLGVQARSGTAPLDLTMSADELAVILEIERSRPPRAAVDAPIVQLKDMIAVLYQSRSLDESLAVTARALRSVTGFDRALVYRFLPDGTGVVAAEDVAPGVDSYLGLHFPASDVPPQARALYTRNWVRSIPDVHYTPAPLEPAVNRRTRRPLDMSACVLRSVSPSHLEYLGNMGVKASSGMSIICHGELWGMIMLHHRSPRYVTADLRVAFEAFAQAFSLQIEVRLQTERTNRRLYARATREELVRRSIASGDPLEGLACPELLRYVGAGGAAVCFGQTVRTIGRTPDPAELRDVISWLTTLGRTTFVTDQLSLHHPPAQGWAPVGSGLLAVSLSREPRDFVLWFRPEFLEAVSWGGDPRRGGEGGQRQRPRVSFAEWRDTQRGKSLPWSEFDLEAAEDLRVVLLEIVLHDVDRTRLERERALERQTVLMAELDHRVKNALGMIQALVRASATEGSSVQDFAVALERRIQAMALAHSLLAGERWEGASLRRLITEEIALLAHDVPTRVDLAGDDVTLTPFEALSLSLVVHELVTNAIKYGAFSSGGGTVSIGWSVAKDPSRLLLSWIERGGPAPAAAKPGFGMTLIQRTVQYELQGTANLVIEPTGIRWDLVVPMPVAAP